MRQYFATLAFLCVGIALIGAAKLPRETRGIASWYGYERAGRLMANGEPFDPERLTCAAWQWGFGTNLRVWHNGKFVDVTVTDRGPSKRLHRLIDLSRASFAALAPLEDGLIDVEVDVMSDAK